MTNFVKVCWVCHPEGAKRLKDLPVDNEPMLTQRVRFAVAKRGLSMTVPGNRAKRLLCDVPTGRRAPVFRGSAFGMTGRFGL